jgi:hypothetical protein
MRSDATPTKVLGGFGLKTAAAVAIVAGAAAWALWAMLGTPSAKDLAAPNVAVAGEAVASGPPKTTAVSPRSPTESSAQAAQVVLAAAGYWPPVTSPEDRDEWARRGLVQRLLTPTSLADLEWMRRNAYPRKGDVENPDVVALDHLVRNGDPRTERDRMNYAANALAAHYFNLDDPRWREYVDRAPGPFTEMLRLIDSARAWDKARNDYVATSRLTRSMLAAQYYGEVGASDIFTGFRGGPPMVSLADVSSAMQDIAVQTQLMNAAGARIGIAPYVPTSRPAPPWSLPPCNPTTPRPGC